MSDALAAARDTRRLEIGEGILTQTPLVFQDLFAERPAVVVADANTFAAAGRAVHEAFQARRHPTRDPFVFGSADMHAEERFLLELEAALREHEAIPIAVGSGTINDLTKLAAHRTGRPYLCVATAASMDGYAAFGASITCDGSKQTFACPAPAGIVADLEVLRAAPAAMNSWGYADLLAKVTAGADWILADALDEEPVHDQAWAIVQGRLREAVADPEAVAAGQSQALARLVEGLMLGGLAMQAAQSSRPASGAEHQFSHLWDMQHHTHQGCAPSHGFKVGIGTLASTALYERLLARRLLGNTTDTLDLETCLQSWPEPRAWFLQARAMFGEGPLADVACREVCAKHISLPRLRQQLKQVRRAWPKLVESLRDQLLPFGAVRRQLQLAGAPVEPEEIGISRRRLRDSFWQAFFIRRRFTVLDLAARTGLLDACLDEIFGPEGVWPITADAKRREER